MERIDGMIKNFHEEVWLDIVDTVHGGEVLNYWPRGGDFEKWREEKWNTKCTEATYYYT